MANILQEDLYNKISKYNQSGSNKIYLQDNHGYNSVKILLKINTTELELVGDTLFTISHIIWSISSLNHNNVLFEYHYKDIINSISIISIEDISTIRNMLEKQFKHMSSSYFGSREYQEYEYRQRYGYADRALPTYYGDTNQKTFSSGLVDLIKQGISKNKRKLLLIK